MESSYILLYGFVLLSFVLLLGIASVRLPLVFAGKHAPNNFKPFGEDVSALAQRLCRAHANCYENLPMVMAIVFIAAMTNQLAVTNGLAIPFLVLRVLQSITHVISTSNLFVNIRFIFFVSQIVILLYWLIMLCPLTGV